MSSSTSNDTSPNDQSPADLPPEPETPSSMGNGADAGESARSRPRDAEHTSNGLQPQQKSRSIVNLTSSTLFGIYSPAGYEPNRDEPATPFGTGAQTPSRSASVDPRKNVPLFTAQAFKEKAAIGKERRRERRKSMQQQRHQWRRISAGSQALQLALQTGLLFAFGLAYGEAITRLHNSGRVAPVQVNRINRSSWIYLAFWGCTGVMLGYLLPFFDSKGDHVPSLGSRKQDEDDNRSDQDAAIDDDDDQEEDAAHSRTQARRGGLMADWSDIVRSIGAFVGIAFAIRKLAWQSTLQVSLTLALVNPVIWYLIDRSRNGIILSSAFGIMGAAFLLGINPGWIPAPATKAPSASSWDKTAGTARTPVNGTATSLEDDYMLGTVSYESIGVATWISSVLFCSSIFFGNIGRRLQSTEW